MPSMNIGTKIERRYRAPLCTNPLAVEEIDARHIWRKVGRIEHATVYVCVECGTFVEEPDAAICA